MLFFTRLRFLLFKQAAFAVNLTDTQTADRCVKNSYFEIMTSHVSVKPRIQRTKATVVTTDFDLLCSCRKCQSHTKKILTILYLCIDVSWTTVKLLFLYLTAQNLPLLHYAPIEKKSIKHILYTVRLL